MNMNLNDWFGQNLWVLWLGISLLLATAEMLTLDFTLLMLASGALAAALTAAALPQLWWLQVIVGCVVAVLMLFILRPTLLRRVRALPGYRSSLSRMVGSVGVATSEVTDSSGEVKVAGMTWSARTVTRGMRVAEGEAVEVYEVDGVTAVVYPTRLEPESDEK